MDKEKSLLNTKWWIRTIRELNYFGFHYYWFNWVLLISFIVAFSSFYTYKINYSAACLKDINLQHQIKKIDIALANCCYCNPKIPVDSIPEKDTLPPPPNALDCDTKTHNGNDGIDEKIYILGRKSGMVTISYNMYGEPDKMEVYYENKLVSSTFTVYGNDNGFVGGNNSAGSLGTLNFFYKYNIDQSVKVVLTGGNGTSWEYQIGCPN